MKLILFIMENAIKIKLCMNGSHFSLKMVPDE